MRREEMQDVKRMLMGLLAWVVAITGLHAWLNVDWATFSNDYLPEATRKLNVAYIPVT
jgi:NitT/TauT family transport system substrate-binding protein